jgi:hypothetical protein
VACCALAGRSAPHELPSGSSSALAGPEGWLEEFEDDAILTLQLRDGALEVSTLPDHGDEAGEAVAERVTTVVQACAGAALDALRAFADAAGVDHSDDERSGEQDEPGGPGAALDDVLAELLLAQPGVLDDPMPPLALLLTAAGLEVTHGAVMLAGAPDDPDEVAGLSTEEIRWFTLACGFLWTSEAERVCPEELGRFLTVLTLSPLVLERVADEVERNPADAALLEAARRAGATPVQRGAAAIGELDDGEEVIRGSVHRQQRQLTITANSVERLGELQQQVLAAAPGSQLVSESIVPMEELLAQDGQDPRATAASDAGARRLGLPPEEEAALLEQVMRDYEQRWLDEKLPALGGRTPRQAAAEGGSALAELHALLDDIQWQADTSGGGMSATRIRHRLGLNDA